MKDADRGAIGELVAELMGEGLRIGVVRARFNDALTSKMAQACLSELDRLEVDSSDVKQVTVPGALEIPVALKAMAESGDFDALIALGCVIRGETYHFELVANESGAGITWGDASKSSLFKTAELGISSPDDDLAMPPKKAKERHPLTKEQLEKVKAFIESNK